MAWGKCVIISLGLMLITHVAHARDIDTFTDSQGTLHITNIGSAKSKSPANLPNPAASLHPGNLPGKTPVTPPVRALAPAVQAPAPSLGRLLPYQFRWPRRRFPGHPYGRLSGVMQAADRTGGQDEPGIAAGATRASLKRVSWTPPQPVKAVANGKIAIYRDRQGVIHITNVPQEEEEPATPVTPAPVVQTLPPEAARAGRAAGVMSGTGAGWLRSSYGPPARLLRPCGRCRVRNWGRRWQTTWKPSSWLTPRP